MDLTCDVLVVGAGCGGVAAALAATSAGRVVIMTEAGDRVGGQLTSQAVPPDEHPWVEATGTTASYRQLRDAVRARYRQTRRLTRTAAQDPLLNPGAAWVSQLSAEPEVFREVLDDMLGPAQATGLLRCLMRHRPIDAEMAGDRVVAVSFDELQTGDRSTVVAAYVLDATEEGDLLPLIGCESVIGAEATSDTGEPHAVEGPADPLDQQAITWCAALEWRPGEDHTIDRPDGYEFWRSYRAAFWPGPQLGWTTQEPETGRPLSRPLFSPSGEQDLWTFRRIRYGGHYLDDVSDVTLVNWPQVDYWLTPLLGVDEATRVASLAKARAIVAVLRVLAPNRCTATGRPHRVSRAAALPRAFWAPPMAWRRRRTSERAAASPPNSPCWKRTSESRLALAPIGLSPSRTRSGLAATGSTCTRARRVGAISTSRPTRSRFRWAPCCRSGSTTCWRPVSALASRTSPTAVTGCIRSNGMSARPPALWPRSASTVERAPRAVRADPTLLADFQASLISRGVQLHWPPQIVTAVR